MARQRHHIPVFATAADWAILLTEIESRRPVKYIEAGSFDPAESPRIVDSFRAVPNPGRAVGGDPNHEPMYLVLDRDVPVLLREVNLRTGQERFAVDQLENPDSVVLRPGGLLGNQALIAGSVDTASNSDISRALLELFRERLAQPRRPLTTRLAAPRGRAGRYA